MINKLYNADQEKLTETGINFFNLALSELSNNRINFAINNFEQALLHGHELSVRYYLFLQQAEDKTIARDIILSAEKYG